MREGMKLPRVTFKVREGDVEPEGPGCPIGGTWKDMTTDDYFKDKREKWLDSESDLKKQAEQNWKKITN